MLYILSTGFLCKSDLHNGIRTTTAVIKNWAK